MALLKGQPCPTWLYLGPTYLGGGLSITILVAKKRVSRDQQRSVNLKNEESIVFVISP